jgi:hypothetical protein
MNRFDALERDLTAWFDETAMPRRPDYTTEIIESAVALPQRRWMAVEKVVPDERRRISTTHVPAVPMVGGRLRSSSPCSCSLLLALCTSVADHDCLRRSAWPVTGLSHTRMTVTSSRSIPRAAVRRWGHSGDDIDELPRWSLDGTRLAFLRGTRSVPADGTRPLRRVVIVDRERNVLAASVSIDGIDPMPSRGRPTVDTSRSGAAGSPSWTRWMAVCARSTSHTRGWISTGARVIQVSCSSEAGQQTERGSSSSMWIVRVCASRRRG